MKTKGKMIRQDLERVKTGREQGTHNFNAHAICCHFEVLEGQTLKRIAFVNNERYTVITENGQWTTPLSKLGDELTQEFDIFNQSFANFMTIETQTNKYLIFPISECFNGNIELKTIHGLDDLQEMMGRTITKASHDEDNIDVDDQYEPVVRVVHTLTADDLFTAQFSWQTPIDEEYLLMIDLSLEDKILALKNSKLSTAQNWLNKLKREYNNERYLSMLHDAHTELLKT